MAGKKLNVLITGTTSGFGALLLKSLLGEGHRVQTIARGGASRFADADLVMAQKTGALKAWEADLSSPESLGKVCQSLAQEPFDVLVNNAGVGFYGTFDELSEAAWREQMEVNFFSLLKITQTALPALKVNRGVLLNVSSIAGRISLPFYSLYNASKFALEGWCEALRYELWNDGVSVYLVEPGSFKTGFVSGVISRHPESKSDASRKFRKFLDSKKDRLGKDPQAVARLMLKLIRKRPRKLRHLIGTDARLGAALRWLLPYALFEKALRTGFSTISRA